MLSRLIIEVARALGAAGRVGALSIGAAAALLVSGAATAVPVRAQEVTLRAVSPWPKTFFITASLLKFIDEVNAAGKGVIQMQFGGGPEAIPANEQGGALRRGAIDVYYGSASYLLGLLPEVDAVAASNLSPQELRANGGYDLLDKILQKKVNAKFISQPDSGWSFFILLSKEPKLTAAGDLDLTGLRLRSHPLYNGFLSSLGATNVVVQTTEMYTAFERGVVDGLAFSEIGVRDFKLEKFLKFRVYPTFFQGDIVTLMNLDKWKSLSPAAKKVLNDVALQHERESRDHFLKEVEAERKALDQLGIKEVRLSGSGAAEYLAKADAVPWARMTKGDPANVAALRAKFRK
jgi:TRAP-type C4-dicarboxylate transport system substrate-binding protein